MSIPTPYQLWERRLTSAKQAYAGLAGECGSLCIRGVDAPQGIVTDQQDMTTEQLGVVKLLILSPQRIRLAEAMRDAMLEDQDNDSEEPSGLLLFNTASSYAVEDLMEAELGARHHDPKTEFDRLLALTLNLYKYEFWLADHEEGAFDHLLSKLGQKWTSVLAKSDAQLGIPARDSFTRAGAITLLEQFQALVDDVSEGRLDFSFSASA
jgi:hypothetical protein